jgi:hypothetical protein
MRAAGCKTGPVVQWIGHELAELKM